MGCGASLKPHSENSEYDQSKYEPKTIQELEGHLRICTELKNLRLNQRDGVELTHLPETFFDVCPHLEELNIYYQKLKTLPESVGILRNLEVIRIDRSPDFAGMPDSIGTLHSLASLDVKSAMFSSFPSSICKLKQLRKLSLTKCQIMLLPNTVGDLAETLHELTLDENPLVALPFTIGKLKNLKRLSLRSCDQLEKLPDSVGDLQELEFVFLTSCSKLTAGAWLQAMFQREEKLWYDIDANFHYNDLGPFSSPGRRLDLQGCVKIDVSSVPEKWRKITMGSR